jgi:hypothetical protein
VAAPSAKARALLDLAMERLKKCVDAESDNRDAAIEDLEFANGDQWPAAERERRSRSNRPCLQFDLLSKYIDQVVGDMLHNQQSIKVRPDDVKADIEIAKIRQGIINQIVYKSNFNGIKKYAGRQQVTCGYGAWRVLTRYTEENPFLQEAYLATIRNPFLVYLDPDAREPFGADAKYGFVLEKMDQATFKEKYPKGKWPTETLDVGPGLGSEHWYDGDTVTVAEYFTVEPEEVVMVQLESGEAVTQARFDEMVAEWHERNAALVAQIPAAVSSNVPGPPPGAMQVPPPHLQAPPPAGGAGPQPVPSFPASPSPMMLPMAGRIQAGIESLGPQPRAVRTRKVERNILRHRVITAYEILDGGEEGKRFPGKYIPVVMLKGKELNIEGKDYVYGLIRRAKDPQKMFNYWYSAAAEYIALAPKTPWIGTARQFEGYEKDYAAANVENFPFLKYNADPDTQTPPQRNSAPQIPDAFFAQMQKAEDLIKSTIGLFNADVGDRGSEQTGAAILARQRPGDVGSYEFAVNMAAAVEHTGRILNEIIPEIYDSERDVRLRFHDETETFAPINTTLGAAAKAVKNNPEAYKGLDAAKLGTMLAKEGESARFNDITTGHYDVVVTTGPSYATQRQEASQALLALMQAAPERMSVALDLVVKNLDFKDADELEARLRKPLLAQGIIKPRAGEEVQPPPPDPKAQSEMAQAQARVQAAQLAVQRESLRVQEATIRVQAEVAKIQAETGRKIDTTILDAIEKERKHSIEAMRVQLEQERLDHQRRKDGMEMQLYAMETYNKRKTSGGK